jgi:hypothetical protein
MPIPENFPFYFFTGFSGAFGASGAFSGAFGASGAFSGAFGASAGVAGAGFGGSACLQPMVNENATTSTNDRSIAKTFFINCHLLSRVLKVL